MGNDTDMDAILKLEDSAMEAWRQGDPMKWTEISADDVFYLDPNLDAPVVGKAAYVRYLDPIKGMVRYDASEYVEPRVAVFGKTAVLTYNYHSLSKDAGGTLQRSSFWNTTEVYRRIKDGWKIIHTHWSYIQHRLPEKPEIDPPDPAKAEALSSGAAADVMRLERGARELWRNGDPAGFFELYAPEATYHGPGTPGRIDGLPEIRDEFERQRKSVRFDALEYVRPQFRAFEDSVVLFYQMIATKLHPDGSVKAREPWNCTEVYAKTDKGWRIVHSHWSYVKGQRDGGGI